MRTVQHVVQGEGNAVALVNHILHQSQWLEIEPLPDDEWEITVKAENARLLEAEPRSEIYTFLDEIARMSMEGEVNGTPDGYLQENDDAFETLQSLIGQARRLVGMRDPLSADDVMVPDGASGELWIAYENLQSALNDAPRSYEILDGDSVEDIVELCMENDLPADMVQYITDMEVGALLQIENIVLRRTE